MTVVIVLELLLGVGSGNLVLAVPAAVVTWGAWVMVNPFTMCRWCKGRGLHPLSGKRYRGACWNPRCQRGTVQRLGSKTVHRAWHALRDYRRQQVKQKGK